MKKTIFTLLCFVSLSISAEEGDLFLRNNLPLAQKGDFLVAAQGKMATLLHTFDRTADTLAIEEISIPLKQLPRSFVSWKHWMEHAAPGNTSWVVYLLQISTGHMLQCYSMTRRCWIHLPEADNFLSTLLNLKFSKIPDWQRKKAGSPPLLGMPDRRPLWQPRLMLNGEEVKGVAFNAYRAHWPKDKSILSDKTIDVYLPQDYQRYPAYFPYWLQISGTIGKAQVHIIDSGHEMQSQAKLPPTEKIEKTHG